MKGIEALTQEAEAGRDERNVQARMSSQGIGIAVLPQVVGNQVGGLRRLSLPEEPPAREIWMGYHRDLRRLNRLRAFIAIVNEHVAGLQG